MFIKIILSIVIGFCFSVNDVDAVTTRIYGGNELQESAYPWIGKFNRIREGISTVENVCTAVLIEANWAVISAHCVGEIIKQPIIMDQYHFVFNFINIENQNEKTPIKIKKIFLDHRYDINNSKYYDLALVRLDISEDSPEYGELSSYIYSDDDNYIASFTKISLLEDESINELEKEGKFLKVVGWGKTENDEKTSILQELDVPVCNQERCNQDYSIELGDDMICAGFDNKNHGAYHGDSGGPLFSCDNYANGQCELIGIVNFGQEIKIGENKFIRAVGPDVYTKISFFKKWIEQIQVLDAFYENGNSSYFNWSFDDYKVLKPEIDKIDEIEIIDNEVISLNFHNRGIRKIPRELKKLKKLKKLELMTNLISEISTSSSIFNLNELIYLSLLGNNLNKITIDKGLKKLEELDLSGNDLEQVNISNLDNLKKLDISNNKLRKFPGNIKNLNKLEEVWAWFNKWEIVDDGISNLQSLKKLVLNYYKDNPATVDTHYISDQIVYLKDLEILTFAYSGVKRLPWQIGELKNLTGISLYGSPVECFPPKSL